MQNCGTGPAIFLPGRQDRTAGKSLKACPIPSSMPASRSVAAGRLGSGQAGGVLLQPARMQIRMLWLLHAGGVRQPASQIRTPVLLLRSDITVHGQAHQRRAVPRTENRRDAKMRSALPVRPAVRATRRGTLRAPPQRCFRRYAGLNRRYDLPCAPSRTNFSHMQYTPQATPPAPAATDASTVIWKPEGRLTRSGLSSLTLRSAMWRGCVGLCPVCGVGRLFAGWLRVSPVCAVCAAPLGDIRADDAPPYFTIFIVAHLVIGLFVVLDRNFDLSVATEMMIFVPATLLLTLVLMRPVKGATVGMMLKLGFMKPSDSPEKGNADA